mmetsp:Transcript_48990/g.131106  ORF Transcript_48990/g.131106 Transcript_48990/m.131106 type:complete len:544 (-) Transcript_48990:70-1701(-)
MGRRAVRQHLLHDPRHGDVRAFRGRHWPAGLDQSLYRHLFQGRGGVDAEKAEHCGDLPRVQLVLECHEESAVGLLHCHVNLVHHFSEPTEVVPLALLDGPCQQLGPHRLCPVPVALGATAQRSHAVSAHDVVLVSHGYVETRQDAPLLGGESHNLAPVDESKPPVVQQHHVARVRIAIDKTLSEEHVTLGLHQVLRDNVDVRRQRRLHVVHGAAQRVAQAPVVEEQREVAGHVRALAGDEVGAQAERAGPEKLHVRGGLLHVLLLQRLHGLALLARLRLQVRPPPVRERQATKPVHDEDPLRAQAPWGGGRRVSGVHWLRHDDVVEALQVLQGLPLLRCLPHVVELVGQVLPDLLDDASRRRQQRLRGAHAQGQVHAEGPLGVGVLDLHHHVVAVDQRGAVHLARGGRIHRRLREGFEVLLQRPQLFLHDGLDNPEGLRGAVLQEGPEIVYEGQWDEGVHCRGHVLADLDVEALHHLRNLQGPGSVVLVHLVPLFLGEHAAADLLNELLHLVVKDDGPDKPHEVHHANGSHEQEGRLLGVAHR